MFIGATTDARLRAFESRTGQELWVAELSDIARSIPITYQSHHEASLIRKDENGHAGGTHDHSLAGCPMGPAPLEESVRW